MQTMEDRTNTMVMEAPAPAPLMPQAEQKPAHGAEKGLYWNSLLTGNLEQVPLPLRRKAGADDETEPAEARDYRLASSINRSWVVDHSTLSRDEVRGNWPELRRNMTRNLGVRDDEQELYSALSLRQTEAPTRDKVRRVYTDAYTAALRGEEAVLPEAEDERRVYEGARSEAERVREAYMPLAEAVSQGWSYLKASESKAFPIPDLVAGAPGLARAVDALAEMPAEERARVYEIARSLESTRQLETAPESLGEALLHSVRRGSADLRHALVQGVGHAATALTRAAGETLESDALLRGAEATDKRLQALHELRSVAQGEVFPIQLEKDSAFWEELAVDAAGAVPGAALAFMGGAGFGALAVSSAGAAVAEARRRSPEGRQELQVAAGIVGGALQAGIYMGMSRIGAQMLNRSIGNFARAGQAGIKGYSLAALKTLGSLTAENARLLLAGKAAQAAELGMQELAARVDHVASHIDWEDFGDNITDIETNMREAAMNLPYILIAAGRAALHHFRSPDALVENRRMLESWDVDEATRQRIIDAPDAETRTLMLREALTSGRRWGGVGFLEECYKSLRLLNTEQHAPFRDTQSVRSFLNLPSEMEQVHKPEIKVRDMTDPETVKMIAERMNETRSLSLLNRPQSADYLRLWDDCYQRGYGEELQGPKEKKERFSQYLTLHSNPKDALPPEFRLDGYYNPHQAPVVKAVCQRMFSEVIRLSYQYIINMESLGSLMNSYKSHELASKQVEKKRRAVVSRLAQAISEGVKGDCVEKSLGGFITWLSGRYDTRRRSAGHAPLWLRKVDRADLTDMLGKALDKGTRSDKKKPAELRDAYRIALGLYANAEGLLAILPHSPDFQELLSSGFSPEQAVSHLMRRELENHLDPEIWMPQQLTPGEANRIDNRRRFDINQPLIDRYMKLTGYGLESSPDGQGKQLWRIRRPDGEYTPWFSSYGLAVNSLVGNAKTLFLQMGRGQLTDNIQRSYRYMPGGGRLFYAGYMYPLSRNKFTGFDHLGRVATDELRTLWTGDSTHFTMGLDYEEDKAKWNRLKGARWMPLLKSVNDGHDSFLVYPRRVETPLTLARLRFFVYWNRLLSSGWVSPEEVGGKLVQAGELMPDKLDYILNKGRDKKLYLWHTRDRDVRRSLLEMYPDRMVPGDKAAMNADLARRMADYNLLYMIADLPNARLPHSVREWFYTSALGNFEVPKSLSRIRGAVRKYNRAAADDVQAMVPRVMEIRGQQQAGQGGRLDDMLRNAYQPDESRRYEQGWCYAVGGASAFRSSGQSFWNLLDDPVRGWKLLTPEERESLAEELRDFGDGQSPEPQLQQLSEVLQEYPGLRAYSSDKRTGGAVKRMVLEPVETMDLVPRYYRLNKNTETMHAPLVKKGFTVEEAAELPAEWQTDSRVLPALQLLTELRRTVTASPYTDESGIWWKQERYGGLDGKRPNGLDERWVPEVGLRPFMSFFERVNELGHAYGTHGQLNVCGVSLGGIGAGDIDTSLLNQITVYRTPRLPEHMVRLMPGEPNAANPYQRKPYVIHTADGIPLLPTRMARQQPELLKALTPLNHFQSDMERMYDFESNHRWRKRHFNAYLQDLLERRTTKPAAWDRADEGAINNLELFMQLFQDGRLSYYLEKKDPTKLNRGEALAAELGRLVMLAEFGTNREAAVEKLVQFCRHLRENYEDRDLMRTALHRIVSPDPNRYKEVELPRPEEDRELDLSPEDAEYY